MRSAVPPPRSTATDPAQLRPQRVLVATHGRLVTLGRALLHAILARPSLRETQPPRLREFGPAYVRASTTLENWVRRAHP
jgi:hypothetical protein